MNEVTEVSALKDYYGSVYVNPTFEYSVNATDNTVTTICTAEMLQIGQCNPNDVPTGIPAAYTFKSFKSPEAQGQLGIEGIGDLFGVPMIFLFVIGLAGIFTGRSAPMGSIFIVATLGVMHYLGYINFMNPDSTWALLIIVCVCCIFLGKRL